MSQKFFPPEIIEHSTEAHFFANSKPFRWIYLALLLIILIALALLPVISVNVTSQNRGVVSTKKENTTIIPSLYGKVKETSLEEGKRVRQGDTLLVLKSDRIDAQLNKFNKNLHNNHLFLDDLHSLLKEKPEELQTPKYKNEWGKYIAGIREIQIKLELLRKDFQQQKYLYNEKVIAEIDYLESKNNLQSIRSELELYKQKARNNWQIEITRLKLENNDIRASLKQLYDEKNQYVITAPATGSLLKVAGIQTGSFVSPGQKLAEISPEAKLIAECYVSSSNIGYIKNGQTVRFQFDAFDYNQWGLLKGSVTKISDDVIVIDKQPVFKVRCKLPSTYLQLKNGQKGYLKKGMTLTGRFMLTRRTLFQLLFDKVDDWLNPKMI